MIKENCSEIQMKVEVMGYEAIEKKVKASGNSGRIYVPIQWMDCRVKIIRLDPLINEKE